MIENAALYYLVIALPLPESGARFSARAGSLHAQDSISGHARLCECGRDFAQLGCRHRGAHTSPHHDVVSPHHDVVGSRPSTKDVAFEVADDAAPAKR
jgi:hypothetical protein